MEHQINFIVKYGIIMMFIPVTLFCCYFGYLDKNLQIVLFGFALLLFAVIANIIVYKKGNENNK